MPHFNHRELLQTQSLVHECCELGDDSSIWLRHFVRGMMDLIDADVIGAGQIGMQGGQFENIGAIDLGWERGFNREGWINALQLFAENPTYHAGLTRGYAAVAAGESTLLSRRQYVSDREWYRSKAYETTTCLMGFDDEMCGFFPIGTAPGDLQCLIIYRDKKKPRFNSSERQRLRLLIEMMQPLIGGRLAGLRELRPSDLPPRVREVLACVLEGDSDKQIASRLGITTNTVHQYLKHIYRFFQLNGRSELMARWIRRGWSSRCLWRHGEPPSVEMIGP